VSATKILGGQVITVFAIVLIAIWTATEWTGWRLGFQPELGRPWFEILHVPFYLPPVALTVIRLCFTLCGTRPLARCRAALNGLLLNLRASRWVIVGFKPL
jgi:hypothetical protein